MDTVTFQTWVEETRAQKVLKHEAAMASFDQWAAATLARMQAKAERGPQLKEEKRRERLKASEARKGIKRKEKWIAQNMRLRLASPWLTSGGKGKPKPTEEQRQEAARKLAEREWEKIQQ